MNVFILIIIGIAGIIFGHWLASRGVREEISSTSVSEQTREKEKRKQKILGMFQTRDEVTNNDVEEFLGVSDSTAEEYLDELERTGKLIQHGQTGRSVFYTLRTRP
jgi:predicted HTH transcriptional regulator